jgi:ankyrin repeat protein
MFARNRLGETALHEAAHRDRQEMVRLLLEEGADVDAKDRHGRTALHRTSSKAVQTLLVQNGADIDARNSLRKRPGKDEITSIALSWPPKNQSNEAKQMDKRFDSVFDVKLENLDIKRQNSMVSIWSRSEIRPVLRYDPPVCIQMT